LSDLAPKLRQRLPDDLPGHCALPRRQRLVGVVDELLVCPAAAAATTTTTTTTTAAAAVGFLLGTNSHDARAVLAVCLPADFALCTICFGTFEVFTHDFGASADAYHEHARGIRIQGAPMAYLEGRSLHFPLQVGHVRQALWVALNAFDEDGFDP